MKLESDFRDYYDHMFDSRHDDAPVFRRLSTSGPDRRTALSFLGQMNFSVPLYGPVRYLPPECGLVVVYHDEHAHRGEQKELMSFVYAQRDYPDSFASEYIISSVLGVKQDEKWNVPALFRPKTFRRLQIGKRIFALEYMSDDTWRSNCGKVDISVLDPMVDAYGNHLLRSTPPLPSSLVAIDFVLHVDRFYAIDLNFAPQIRGTGIEEIMPANDVVREIEGFERPYFESGDVSYRDMLMN